MDINHSPHGTENHRLARAAGVVGLATMLSRVFGFIRDVIVARFFGAGLATDAFFVAFRIPNLLRRLFAEGSLTIAFVPVFTEYLKTKSREDAFELARVAFTLLSVILVVISLAGVIFSPAIVTVMAPGFRATPDKYALTVLLTRIMFPYIFFISLVALCMGILNSLRHFATPALSPVILNLCMIGAALFLRDYFAEPILALAIGVMIGGLLQLAVQLPVLFKLGVVLRPDFHFRHTGVRRIGALMLPAAFGAAVYQINIFISTLLASFLPEGSVSFLYYADRIVELPLGIFGIAIGTAALPSFSDQVARGHYEEMKKTISFSLRLMLFITIPAMIGIIALQEPIISVLFQRGQFDPRSSVLTAQALFWYTVGLWAFSTIRVVVAAFYALQDTKTPVLGHIHRLGRERSHAGLAAEKTHRGVPRRSVLALGGPCNGRIGDHVGLRGLDDAHPWMGRDGALPAPLPGPGDGSRGGHHRFCILRHRPSLPGDDDALFHDPPQAQPPLTFAPHAFRDKMIDLNVSK
jgi:putative peptidoglycan lipid II flippase